MKRLQKKTRRFLRRAIQYGSFYVLLNGFLWGFLQVSSSAYRRMEANPPAATAVSASPDGTLSLSILTKQAQLHNRFGSNPKQYGFRLLFSQFGR